MQNREISKRLPGRPAWRQPFLALLVVLALALASTAFAGRPAPIKSLAFSADSYPAQILGKPFGTSIQVRVLSNGVVNTSDSKTKVTLAASGPGKLLGTLVKTAVKGVATFSGLSYDNAAAGSYVVYLTAYPPDNTFAGPAQSWLNVRSIGTAFSVQPGPSATVGVAWAPFKVRLTLDGYPYTADDNTLITLSANGTGSLSGTLTQKVTAGEATFSGITYDAAGSVTLLARAADPRIMTSSSSAVTVYPATFVSTTYPVGFPPCPVNSTVTARFSVPVDPATVNANTFLVQRPDGGYLSGTYAFYDNSTRVVFTPAGLLATSTSYTGFLTTDIRNASGEAMRSTYSWLFSTKPPGWGEPPIQMSSGGTSMAGGLAMSGNGSAVAFHTYWDNASSFFQIRGSVYSPMARDSSGWGAGQLLFNTTEPTSGSVVTIPTVKGAADNTGNSILVWSEPVGGFEQPVAGRVLQGIPGTPQPIGGQAERVYPPLVSMNPSGVALASWITATADMAVSAFLANRMTPAGLWGTAVLLSAAEPAGTTIGDAVSAIGNGGAAAAAWVALQPGNPSSNPIRVRLSDRNGNWLPEPLTIAMDGSDNTILAVAVAPDDAVILLTARDNAVLAYMIVSGVPTGPPTMLSIPGGAIQGGPGDVQVAVDASGNALAAWVQRNPQISNEQLAYNRYVPGTGWAGWGTIYSGIPPSILPTNAAQPRVAYAGNGDAFIAWSQADGYGISTIFTSRNPAGNPYWASASYSFGPGLPSFYPTLGADDRGNAIVVWDSTVTTADDIYSKRYQGVNP